MGLKRQLSIDQGKGRHDHGHKITADKKTMDVDHGIRTVKQGGIAYLGIEC